MHTAWHGMAWYGIVWQAAEQTGNSAARHNYTYTRARFVHNAIIANANFIALTYVLSLRIS